MGKEKKTEKENLGGFLGDEGKTIEWRRGKYNISKRFRKQNKNMGMELIKSSWRKSEAEMQQDA